MFTHPDFLWTEMKEHQRELVAEADRSRLLGAALRRRRAARAEVRHQPVVQPQLGSHARADAHVQPKASTPSVTNVKPAVPVTNVKPKASTPSVTNVKPAVPVTSAVSNDVAGGQRAGTLVGCGASVAAPVR